MRVRGWLVLGVAIAAALLLVGRAVTSVVVDHAWFTAMGVPALWWERAIDAVLLQGTACVVGSAFAFANLHAVRRTIHAVAVPSRVANIELTAEVPGGRLLWITIVLSLLLGVLLSAPLTDWTQVAMARHGIPFGEIEGFLDRDLGFYVYWVPLEESLYVWALASVVAVGFVVMVLYAITRSLRIEGRRVFASTHARRHMSVLGALILLLLAWSYRLDGFDLLRNGSGADGLFLRVDHVVSLRVDVFMTALCGIGALLMLRAGWMGQLRLAFITLSIVLAGALGLRHMLPALVIRTDLIGEPQRRDLDYVTTRALVSRRAYDVDGMHANEIGAARQLSTRIRTNDLARAISVWDASNVQLRATDASRSAVGVSSVSWAPGADGSIRALVARRPISADERWSASLVDATMPILRDSVLTLTGDAEDVSGGVLAQAVGPGLAGHRLIKDPGGTMLGTTLRSIELRIAHAWAGRDPALLSFDRDGDALPVYVSQRDVRERVSLLAPIFAQGEQLLPIVHDGELYWTLNLYSASDSYPLSQQWQLAGEVRSYFRFAATALIEASTGQVRLVPTDRIDPVARTWFARVPALVTRTSELPVSLVALLPPATDAAIAQLRTFARYGSRLDGAVVRHVPDSTFSGDGPRSHLLQSDSGSVVAWSVPLLDANDQVSGVVSAIGGRYRRTSWDTTATPRERWSTITDRLRRALDTVRAQTPDLTRRAARVRDGQTQIVLGEHGLIVVQPQVWTRSDGSTVIGRVAIEESGHLALGATVADALSRSAAGRPGGTPRIGSSLFAYESKDGASARLYDVMRQAMRNGDWVRFGAAFDSLGNVLSKPPQ